MTDLRKNSVMMTREQKTTGTTVVQSFRIKMSKPLLDRIDDQLLPKYGLEAVHADFIKSYDLAWRLGTFSQDEDQDA